MIGEKTKVGTMGVAMKSKTMKIKNEPMKSAMKTMAMRSETMENSQYIDRYFREMGEIITTIDRKEINRIIEMFFKAWKAGRQVFLMGNGGSASTATHFTSDLAKTAIVPGKKRFRAIGLTDNIPLMSAWTNDEGWSNLFVGQLENLLRPGDVVVGFSVHGGSGEGNAGAWSQNLPKAMQYAKDHGARTIGFSGFDGGVIKQMADACIIVPFNSTAHVESFHVVLQHLIIFRLKEMIQEYQQERQGTGDNTKRQGGAER